MIARHADALTTQYLRSITTRPAAPVTLAPVVGPVVLAAAPVVASTPSCTERRRAAGSRRRAARRPLVAG